MKRIFTLLGIVFPILFAMGCQDTPEDITPEEQTLELSAVELAFVAEGGSQKLNITATSAWSASIEGAWCTLSATEGEGNASLTVTAEPNMGEARTATITFTMGDKNKSVTITQLAAEGGLLDLLQNIYEVPAEGATLQVALAPEDMEKIEYEYDPNHEWIWISVGMSEDGSFCGIHIEILANVDAVARECVVKFTFDSESKDITLRQAAAEAYVEAEPEVVEVDFKAQDIILHVGGNVEYTTTYSEGCDWISFSKENYEGTHFSVAENPSSEARQGEIIFANSEYGVSAKVIVKQEGRPERPASPPSNQIWYSTWGYGETPYIDDSSFDQKIVSNIYYWDEKLGIITFEGDVTEIKDEGWDYDDRCTKIILPESVTKVGNKGFYKCTRLEKFVAPGLTTIGEESFAECENLTDFDWGKLTDIPYKAFYKAGFVDLVIPGQIKDISGAYAFRECKNLKTLAFEEGVESISGSYVFTNSTAVESVKFPSTMKSIEEGAFYANYALVSIEWGGLESIGLYAFSGCMALEELEVPATVKYVGSGAFHQCEGLKKVVIAAETIDSGAFMYCKLLTDIEIKPTTTNWIGTGVFSDCDALEHFTFPDHFKSTGKDTFMYCDNLKTVDFANIEVIEEYCFAYCQGLTEINIPGTVKSIEIGVYMGCYNIESVTFNEGTELIYASFGDKVTTFTFPASVKVLGGRFIDGNYDGITEILYFKGDCPDQPEDNDSLWAASSQSIIYCPLAYYDNFVARKNTHLGHYVEIIPY